MKHAFKIDNVFLTQLFSVENRLRADNKELDRREKQDFEKRERRPLARSKSDASDRRPKRTRPHSGAFTCCARVHAST